jgi:PUA domain protein
LKFHRYSIKSKESKRFFLEISKKYNFDLENIFGSKSKVEIVETKFGQLYLINKKPLFFKLTKIVIPTLLFEELLGVLPRIIVDMGAVPYVCKGANIMVPGIVEIDHEFKKGSLVLIVDEKHKKSLAIGESIYSSDKMMTMKKGVVVKNLHFVSDKIWEIAKALIEK